MTITPASVFDLTAIKQLIAEVKPIHNMRLLADKAYIDAVWIAEIKDAFNITLYSPRKRKKGAVEVFPGADAASAFVSSLRQPIESFFHWLNEMPHIQIASKVRSSKGLLALVFARLAAALFFLAIF